ncbi:hypothetical protein GALMADRAFT_126606 [Galerina marginata CBS 339.88]|uniref:DUF6534 domain-containing protein n=1 Tax=Galerina marginata (strain CBS 339.88) TaxID=685588 RepID=A0A067SM93_GALM3|nr:hypothetical protein GALMADRAFT_126606 [Galerina marginata CBS 339.88]
MVVDISKSFGALLIGGLFASTLSGFVIVQVFVYFKTYPADLTPLKSLVLAVWFLDTCHTAFIWSALWGYLIDNYGAPDKIDVIHWNLALTIVMTAILTFLVHLFFAYRIFMLSKKNYYLTTPIVILAILRLVSASVTTAEMLHYGTFSQFREKIRWVFTTGLALSTTVDVLITTSLIVLLQTSRTDAANLNAIIDSLIKYSFETGTLTCAGTVISMICWLTMPTNLIFMGLHFVIGKFYANSLLVTLNMRANIRRSRSQTSKDYNAPVHLFDTRRRHTSESDVDHFQLSGSGTKADTAEGSKSQPLEVSVERSVQYDL